MRPYWKGYLKLALVSCPIALHAACSSAERIALRQINKATGNRLRQQLIDEETREPVAPEHKARGYEVAKGQYLIVEDAELERSRSRAHTPSRLTALCRAPRSTSASSIALITRSRQNPAPSCLIPGAAAQTRVVSVAKIRLDRRKSTRLFKGIICDDISEIAVGTLITERPPQSGRVEARTGLRMMPTFPRPSP